MSTAGWGECSLQECSVERSVFKYRPALAANSLFIALFGVSCAMHAFQGARYRQWTFSILLMIGCICEMIGYGGRIIMYNDPWSFNGFIMQIVCITIAPVFMTAAIYVTLYKSVMLLSQTSARFRPAFYYQIFIPCDIISLVLQSVGGAMSSQSDGSSQAGVNIGLAGLSFQVVTLLIFIGLAVDYSLRYRRDATSGRVATETLDRKYKTFFTFLSVATVLIFIRCVFRIYELSDGYGGPALHNEGIFIALESCMIVLAVFALNLGHPGPAFASRKLVEGPVGYSSEEQQGKPV